MGNSATLHSVCAYGDLAGVKMLLKTCTEAELEAKDENGRTPLLVAVAAMKRKDDDLDSDDDNLDGFDFHGDGDDSAGAEHRSAGDESHSEDVEEFNESASIEPIAKETEILHLLIQKKVNLDHQDENGWTALHHACFIQNAAAVRMLAHAGAHPMRDSYGLLPQDLLMRGHASEWATQAQELKDLLDRVTDKSTYMIRLLAFRPSGIVQLDLGAQVEKGSFVTIEYDVPENHSTKDYIQVLKSAEDSPEIEIGSYHHVPAGSHGQITISTQEIPSSTTLRFVYVKTDINKISRTVVASGCNAVVQASVGEIFQYELFLYERVVEVESVPEFEFIDQPLIVLKRIGIVKDDNEIDWVDIRPDNHIVAVNDIRIDTMEFGAAVQVLQENNGKKCTKLLMQNYSVSSTFKVALSNTWACGDFIPEKILGVGVIGKYAFLQAIHEEGVVEHKLEAWVAGDAGECVASSPESAEQGDFTPQITSHHAAVDSKLVLAESGENPAYISYDNKVSSPSTIESVVPLHTSRQLVDQLHVGIAKAVK